MPPRSDLPAETVAQMTAARDAATMPVPSNDGLIESIALWRRSLDVNDPASVYHKRPDLVAKAELEIQALELRAGISKPVAETAATVAARQHAAMFTQTALAPAVV